MPALAEGEERPLSNHRYTPSKPVVVLSTVAGVAILVLGLVRMLDGGAAQGTTGVLFLALWCVAGVAITGRNLWVAFSSDGAATTVPVADDDADRPR